MAQSPSTYSPTIDYLQGLSPHLWTLSLVFYGLGDIVTTIIGLQLGGITEVGPLPALIAHIGPPAFIGLKTTALVLFACIWKVIPEPHNIGVPLALATLGVLVTTWNLAVILVILA